MSDYTELVKALRGRARREDEYYEHGGDVINDAAAAIEELQAELPKRGKWVMAIWNNAHILCRCSVCGNEMFTKQDCVKKHKYCFNCGAKMEVQE